jgi:hypothetical protein
MKCFSINKTLYDVLRRGLQGGECDRDGYLKIKQHFAAVARR